MSNPQNCLTPSIADLRFLAVALAAAFLLVGPATTASAQGKPWSGSSIVRDPEWQARFMGSYGFLSGAEPDVKPSELEVLKEVIEVMKSSPRTAATVLESRTGGGSSAALDFILANLRFQNGQLPEAIESYELALSKFPDFRRAHKNLGLLMVQVNEFAGATEHLTRAIELGERDGRAFGLLGYCTPRTPAPGSSRPMRTSVWSNPWPPP